MCWQHTGIVDLCVGRTIGEYVFLECPHHTITIDQFQFLAETNSNFGQICVARFAIFDAMNRWIFFQCTFNGLLKIHNVVTSVGQDARPGQQWCHWIWLQPGQTLAKVFIFCTQFRQNECTCAVLKPFMLPQWFGRCAWWIRTISISQQFDWEWQLRNSSMIGTFFDVQPKLLQLIHVRFQCVDIEDSRFITESGSNTAKPGRPYAMNRPNALLRWQQTDIVFFLLHPFQATGYRPTLCEYQHIEFLILVLNEIHIFQFEAKMRESR